MTADGTADPQGNFYRFGNRADAKSFVQSLPIKARNTTEVYITPGGSRTTKAEFDAGRATRHWDVEVQHKHMEAFPTYMEAHRRYEELERASRGIDVDGSAMTPMPIKIMRPENKRWQPAEVSRAFLSREFERALDDMKRSPAFQRRDPASQKFLENLLMEQALRAMGPTRIQASRLPRAYVAGASPELVQNHSRYGLTYSGYIARLEHMPAVDRAMKAMSQERTERRDEQPHLVDARAAIHNEFERRLYDPREPSRNNLLWRAGDRLLQLSFLDKLASPAFHMINAMETWTIAVPEIGGRHGFGTASMLMKQAYRDIGGARDTVGWGIGDTVRAWKDSNKLHDFSKTYEQRWRDQGLADAEELIDVNQEMIARNLVGPNAGMELQERTQKPTGMFAPVFRGLDRMDHMARQMGGAIEAMNRTTTMMAAYRAEKALQLRNGRTNADAKEIAKQYALDVVYKTMGDYSAWNTPKIMKSPLGRMAFQFKKYGLKMYQLMIMNGVKAWHGDKEAMKSLGGVLATHAMLAGTLGLPLEPIKAIALAAGLFDSDLSPQNLETAWRQFLVDHLGQDLGRIAARGLPGYMGVDLQRVGLDNLMLPFSQPKSDKPGDLAQYLTQSTLGAPFAMVLEWPQAVNKLLAGDILGGSAGLVPLKAYADAATALQRLTEGKKTPGGKQAMDPYTPGEAITRFLGFTPGREAETSEMRAFVQSQKADRTKTRRQEIADWVTAPDNATRQRVWEDIQDKNDRLPAAARLTLDMLGKAEQRRESDLRTGRNQWGIIIGRGEQDIGAAARRYYSP